MGFFWGSQGNFAVADLNFMLSILKQMKEKDPGEYYRRAKDPVFQKPLQEAYAASQGVTVSALQTKVTQTLVASTGLSTVSNVFALLDSSFKSTIEPEFLPILAECIGIDLTAPTQQDSPPTKATVKPANLQTAALSLDWNTTNGKLTIGGLALVVLLFILLITRR